MTVDVVTSRCRLIAMSSRPRVQRLVNPQLNGSGREKFLPKKISVLSLKNVAVVDEKNAWGLARE